MLADLLPTNRQPPFHIVAAPGGWGSGGGSGSKKKKANNLGPYTVLHAAGIRPGGALETALGAGTGQAQLH